MPDKHYKIPQSLDGLKELGHNWQKHLNATYHRVPE